ncbi:MAG TPA: hypothetical protein VF062_17915 [Candidatus Limnocylindrales bacterium]
MFQNGFKISGGRSDVPHAWRTTNDPKSPRAEPVPASWIAVLAAFLGVVLACGSPKPGDVDSGGNQAPSVEETTKSKVAVMGQDSVTLKDGLVVSTSAPAAFTASDTAAGMVPGGKSLKFNITLKNTSKDVVDVSYISLNVSTPTGTGSQIYDSANGIGGADVGQMAPDQTATVAVAFSVPGEAKTINVNVQPSSADVALFSGELSE